MGFAQLLLGTGSRHAPLLSALWERHCPSVLQSTHLIDAGVRDVVFLEKGITRPPMSVCSLLAIP